MDARPGGASTLSAMMAATWSAGAGLVGAMFEAYGRGQPFHPPCQMDWPGGTRPRVAASERAVRGDHVG